jgi:hypothetical protein
MTFEAARELYREIIDAAQQRGVEITQQDHSLPAATIRDRVNRGEVMVIRPTQDDYRVIWFPPEVHVGQDLAVVEPSDEGSVLDVSLYKAQHAIARIFGNV